MVDQLYGESVVRRTSVRQGQANLLSWFLPDLKNDEICERSFPLDVLPWHLVITPSLL
jgi:hypothetical protein